MNFHDIDFESFYVVRPRDTLWKIASEFEITNSGIQRFIDYLLLMNPFLKSQRNGDLIYSGQIIMLNTPDFSYHRYLLGDRNPFPTAVFGGLKQGTIEDMIRSNQLHDQSKNEEYKADLFFSLLGNFNNGFGGLNLAALPLAKYNQQLNNYKIFIERSLDLAKDGKISRSSFISENTMHLKNMSNKASSHMEKLAKNLERSMEKMENHVGNYAKKTFNNKKIIRISRKSKRAINKTLNRISQGIDRNYKWGRYGSTAVAKGLLFIDVSLRAKSVYEQVGKGSSVYKETLKESCGFIIASGLTTISVAICSSGKANFTAKTFACAASLAGIIGYKADKYIQKACYKVAGEIDNIADRIFQ